MDAGRRAYYRERVDGGRWRSRALVDNMLRRFRTLCRQAGEREFTIHDLRRSCITNWARKLPIHVVRQLAGHARHQHDQEVLSVRAGRRHSEAEEAAEGAAGDLTP